MIIYVIKTLIEIPGMSCSRHVIFQTCISTKQLTQSLALHEPPGPVYSENYMGFLGPTIDTHSDGALRAQDIVRITWGAFRAQYIVSITWGLQGLTYIITVMGVFKCGQCMLSKLLKLSKLNKFQRKPLCTFIENARQG